MQYALLISKDYNTRVIWDMNLTPAIQMPCTSITHTVQSIWYYVCMVAITHYLTKEFSKCAQASARSESGLLPAFNAICLQHTDVFWDVSASTRYRCVATVDASKYSTVRMQLSRIVCNCQAVWQRNLCIHKVMLSWYLVHNWQMSSGNFLALPSSAATAAAAASIILTVQIWSTIWLIGHPNAKAQVKEQLLSQFSGQK